MSLFRRFRPSPAMVVASLALLIALGGTGYAASQALPRNSVTSVQVKDPNLEAHLQGPEFFDAERFPQLSFEAKEVSRSGGDLTLVGGLTLKGHTEEVEIKGHINDPAPDPYGGERFGLQLETTVDRTNFGLNWNNPLPSGDPALSNDVTITVDLQLAKE